jgi:hypothetical protein
MAKKKQITSKKSKRKQADGGAPSERNPSAAVQSSHSSSTLPVPRMLLIELLSDTTFGRGEGTAGSVDTEVEHDDYGMPYIGGKSIRGLLRDSWLSMQAHFPELHDAAGRVLGYGQALDDTCRLRIGDAVLPDSLRQVLLHAVERGEHPIAPTTMLKAFTEVRYQTAEDRATGAPDVTTLRSSRVVLRDFAFESKLSWLNDYKPQADDLRVLALSALSCRHGGLLRNRGRGHLRLTLDGEATRTKGYLEATP